MKATGIVLALIFSLTATSYAQKFKAERENDISKYTSQMDKLETAYFQHNMRTIKKSVKSLVKIMNREIERTKEEVALIKHDYYGNNASDGNQKIELVIKLNRLKTMVYIQNRVINYDLEQLESCSLRKLSGYKNGLNYFKTLMTYNYNPALAIHRMPANAKRVITPVKEKIPSKE
jgi:hypothetical protein